MTRATTLPIRMTPRALAGALCLLAACADKPAPHAPSAPSPPAIPSGVEAALVDELRAAGPDLQVALCYIEAPRLTPERALEGACRAEAMRLSAAQLQVARGLPALAPGSDAVVKFAASTEVEHEALSRSKVAPWSVRVTGRGTSTRDTIRAGVALQHCLARETGAFLWDPQTDELFDYKAFAQLRVRPPTEEIAVERHLSIGSTAGSGRRRTRGMRKLGLPELALRSDNDDPRVAVLINLVAQALLEGATPSPTGQLDLNLVALRGIDEGLRELVDDREGEGEAQVPLAIDVPKAGQTTERGLELKFPGDERARAEALQRVLVRLFGPSPSEAQIKAADAEVRRALLALRPRYAAGLPAGQVLEAKGWLPSERGPLPMWVRVTSWTKDVLRGTLAEELREVTALKRGTPVELKITAVTDYRVIAETERDTYLVEGRVRSRVLKELASASLGHDATAASPAR